jgi:gas vesicle protein
MNTTTKMSLGILGGICAGFCMGLLMAPDKGSNSRKKVVDTAGDWALKLKHMFSSDGQARHKPVSGNGTARAHAAKPRRTQPKRGH